VGDSLFLTKFTNGPKEIGQVESKPYKDVCLGLGFLLMKTEGNELYSIGDNRQGQCGTPDTLTNQVASPRHIPFKQDISMMSAGLQFSMVLDSSSV
jgi:alpha-tubulin suppressor-like RCC1 family protein